MMEQETKYATVEDLDAALKHLTLDTLQDVQDAATSANTLAAAFGKENRYFASDRGAAVSPRYAVVQRPQIGDKVSQGFNGDYYPAGEITSISRSMNRIETSAGYVFTRRKPYRASISNSAMWRVKGSECFTMVRGHIARRNMEF